MYSPEFKVRGRVRAVFVVDLSRCGCIDATSREKAEESGNIWAVGKWIRDDDRHLQEKLEDDLRELAKAYRQIGGNDYCGGVMTYEYMPYKN